MQPTEAAYLAGLIDGEGCIHAALIGPPGAAKTRLQLLLEVWNTDEAIIEYLHSTLGGHRSAYKGKKAHHKQLHVWRVSIGGVRKILPLLAPYLRIKKGLAMVALELADLPVTAPGRTLDPDILARREDLVGQIRALNRRGRPSPSPAPPTPRGHGSPARPTPAR